MGSCFECYKLRNDQWKLTSFSYYSPTYQTSAQFADVYQTESDKQKRKLITEQLVMRYIKCSSFPSLLGRKRYIPER